MIFEFFDSHMKAPFPPGAHGIQIPDDVDLAMLDADVVGLADAYLKRGRLAPEQRSMLEGYVTELRRVVPELPEEMRDYFVRLHALGVAVLRELPARGAAD